MLHVIFLRRHWRKCPELLTLWTQMSKEIFIAGPLLEKEPSWPLSPVRSVESTKLFCLIMAWQAPDKCYSTLFIWIFTPFRGKMSSRFWNAQDNKSVFRPTPRSLRNSFCQYIPWSTDFSTFHFQVMVFFYEKCIMHNRLPDYHIVALAICETSNPAVLWKLNLQTRMICTAALNPHQRAQWLNEMLDPGQVCSGAPSLLEERKVFRGFAQESLHTLGKPRVWEDQCLRQ